MTAPSAQAISASCYELGGRLLAFRYCGAEAEGPTENFLSSYHLRPVSGATAADSTVDVFYGPPPPVPDGSHTFQVPRGVCHVAGSALHLDIDESRIFIHPRHAERVQVWLGETEHARHPVAVINALSYAVPGALRKAGLFDLHAACVVEPSGGRGLIIAGNSGSGKSSLTIRLAAAGWGYLTDDLLALREESGVVNAWAFRRAFSISRPSLARAGRPPLLGLLGPPVNSDPSKHLLDPAACFPGQFAESCTPRALCFPSVTGEAVSRLERLSQAEAMRRLVRHSPWAAYDTSTARSHLAALARLASQCRVYELGAGLDLYERPGRAAELLAACFGDQD
ncbi:MAG TPA: hypothetical protein VK421_11025 [Pyrinomonadaceae bacterium]|nr:hypothetical protein [Pyrinomonadaceae bacterium]